MELLIGVSLLSLASVAGWSFISDSEDESAVDNSVEEKDYGSYTIEGAFGPIDVKFDPFADDKSPELVSIKENHISNSDTTLATVFETGQDTSMIYIDDTMSALKLPSNFDPNENSSILDDTIFGGDGDDFLLGHFGDNTLFGGAGDDELSSRIWDGKSEVYGGAGHDKIEASTVTPESHYFDDIYGNSFENYDESKSQLILDAGSGDDIIDLNGTGFVLSLGDGADEARIGIHVDNLTDDENWSERNIITDFDPDEGDNLIITITNDENAEAHLDYFHGLDFDEQMLWRENWSNIYLSDEISFSEEGSDLVISAKDVDVVTIQNQSLETLKPYLDAAKFATDNNSPHEAPKIQFRFL